MTHCSDVALGFTGGGAWRKPTQVRERRRTSPGVELGAFARKLVAGSNRRRKERRAWPWNDAVADG